MSIDPATLPRKINIGCGFDIREGYLNVDSGDWHKPDLLADVTDLAMLPSGHFDEAVAQDVLEHIGRTKQLAVLTEWARLLIDGGNLQVRVPSVVDMVTLLRDPSFRNNTEQQHYWVQMLYGTQAYPGDFHLCGYTYLTIVDIGLRAKLFLSRAEIKDGWLFDVTFRKVSSVDELTDTEWLHFQYMSKLQRVPDAGGMTYWTQCLTSKELSRDQVLQEFTQSQT